MTTGKNRETKTKHKHKRGPEAVSGGGVKKTSAFKHPQSKTPLGDNGAKKKKQKHEKTTRPAEAAPVTLVPAGSLPAPEQLTYFLNRFQSSNDFKLSSLELEAIKDTCILELSEGQDQDAESLSKHMKDAFGKSWKEVLYDGQVVDGEVEPGCPAVLVISTSALRSLELFRGLRTLTRECRAAKLFAKHMKVEEQVAALKNRVNIASGTPSRIKKLIDMEAMGVSRLSVIVLDMETDAKGYSLFTLPQVSNEFWDLYQTHFHQRVIEGGLRICLYGGSIPTESKKTTGDA